MILPRHQLSRLLYYTAVVKYKEEPAGWNAYVRQPNDLIVLVWETPWWQWWGRTTRIMMPWFVKKPAKSAGDTVIHERSMGAIDLLTQLEEWAAQEDGRTERIIHSAEAETYCRRKIAVELVDLSANATPDVSREYRQAYLMAADYVNNQTREG